MPAPADYLAVVQRTPEWIEARQDGIGASEAAASVGLSRWESRYSLWARKCRLVPPPATTLAMEIGTLTEPLNAARYAEATGMQLRRVNRLMRSRAVPFALASLDRRRSDGRLVELKWSERAEGYGDPGTDEVPEAVACQVTHQMFVAGADCADVSLLTGSREGVRIYTVPFDPEFAQALIDGERDFWRHVEERTEPEIDGSDATLDALAAAYPREESPELIPADADVRAALAAYLDVVDAIASHDANRKALRAVLESAIGTAAGVEAPGVGRITWKATKDRASVAWEQVAGAYRERLAEDLAVAESRGLRGLADAISTVLAGAEALYTTSKAGPRQFLARRDEEGSNV